MTIGRNGIDRLHTRRAIDSARLVYVVLVLAQATTISLYETGRLPKSIALFAGLATSLVGPLLSFLISLHVFRHRRRSRALDIATIAISYAITCTSFAVIYTVISRYFPKAFNQPTAPDLSLGSALYFSIVTITTTGYGDISPACGLARLAACWEIATGLLYQVFVFSLAASLMSAPAGDANSR